MFSNIMATPEQFSQIILTIAMLSASFGVDSLVNYFIWEGHFTKIHKIQAPGLLVGIVRAAIYIIGVLSILQFVYGQTVTALATISGAFAIILGLSAQTTLGEMFAGIAIAISRPFRIGDWVKIGDLDEGQVVDQTWRLVRIKMRDKTLVNVTNRIVAERPVKNFSFPNDHVKSAETVYISQNVDPFEFEKLMIAALKQSGIVLDDPAPNVLFRHAADGLAEYGVSYAIDNYGDRVIIADKVWKLIHATLKSNGIPFGISERRLELIGKAPV